MGWQKGWTFYPVDSKKEIIHQPAKLNEPDSQNINELWVNFLQSIKTNQLPLCDIETGHRSTNLSLLGMISLKTGRSLQWDGEKELIVNDPEASKLLSRDYRSPWEYPRV
jgi:hypothetical protein